MPCNTNSRGGSSFAPLLMAINPSVSVLASTYQCLSTFIRDKTDSGHPLAGCCQERMLCLGGASRHCFSFFSDASRVIAPVCSNLAANESRQTPIWLKQETVACPRPGRLVAPEERWCRFVSNVSSHYKWLPVLWLQSFNGARRRRFILQCKGESKGRPTHLKWFYASPLSWVIPAVIAHAKQRPTSNGLPSFMMS